MRAYQPLIVLVAVVLITSTVLYWVHFLPWMPMFMGLFLVIFGMIKLFDLPGFAKNFAAYDVVAKHEPAYGFVYPFIEITLGWMYLADINPMVVNALTAMILGIGLIGIFQAMRSGKGIKCACMGNLLNVPVGTVTVVENGSMVAMALISLIF